MERSEILASMGELKLYGMKASFDQIVTMAVRAIAFELVTVRADPGEDVVRRGNGRRCVIEGRSG